MIKQEVRAVRFSRTIAQVKNAGLCDDRVCLVGEVGTGKRQAAMAIHHSGSRAHEKFIALNCLGSKSSNFEIDLFGKADQEGRLVRRGAATLASHGTLYLHEIGELDKKSQAILTRFLESGTFRAVEGFETFESNARILTSSSIPLENSVDTGNFREDLYHLITPLVIHLPRLNDRKDDIPFLTYSILSDLGYGRELKLESGAIEILVNHNFTGNLLELRNIISRAISVCEGGELTVKAINSALKGTQYYDPSSEGGSHAMDFGTTPQLKSDHDKVAFSSALHATIEKAKFVQPEHFSGDSIRADEGVVQEFKNEKVDLKEFDEKSGFEKSLVSESLEAARGKAEEVGFHSVKEQEIMYFKKLIEKVDGNKAAAAEIAGISLRTLYRRLKECGLD